MKKTLFISLIIILGLILTISVYKEKETGINTEPVESPDETPKPIPLEKVMDETKKTDKQKADEKKSIAVIEKHIEFAEKEDIEGYMKQLATNSGNDTLKETIKNSFEKYDLDYEILEAQAVTLEENISIIRVKQKVTVKGSTLETPANDNLVFSDVLLVKEGDEWKLGSNNMYELHELDKEGNVLKIIKMSDKGLPYVAEDNTGVYTPKPVEKKTEDTNKK